MKNLNKNQKIGIGVGAGALVLCAICVCVLGIVGFVYQDEVQALLGLAPAQDIAALLPEDTDMYMSVTPNIQNLPGYQNLKTLYLDNPDIQALIDEFEQEVSEEGDITFEEDIQPWLGNEVVIGMSNLTVTVNDPDAIPNVVFAAKSADTEASDNFIAKVLAEAERNNEEFSQETYKDVTLYTQEGQPANETFTLATFNDVVTLSNNQDILKGMIDRSQDGSLPSFVDDAKFQSVTSQLPSESIFTFYMDFATFTDALTQQSDFELPPEQLQTFEAFDGMGVATVLQSDGIELDFVVTYDVEKLDENSRALLDRSASANEVLNNVPANTVFLYNTVNLNEIWEANKKSLESNPDFSEGLADLEQEIGLSLDEDVFSWMTGETAVVLLEVTPPDEFSPPLGGYLLLGTDDVDNAKSRVEKIVGVLEEQQMLPPLESQNVGGVEMNVLTDFDGAVQAGYGFYENYFMLGYLAESIEAATSASQNPLTGSQNFSAVQARLPSNNYGYLYVDAEISRRLIEDQLSDFEREDYNKYALPFIEPVRAFGVAANSEGADTGVSRGTFFILITGN